MIFCSSNLGYTKEYTRRILYGERKPYYQKGTDGKITFFWNNILADVVVEENKATWGEIRKQIEKIGEKAELFKKIHENMQRMEWDKLEEVYGEERVHEDRLSFNKFIENELPDVNANEVVEHINSILNPIFDKIKDSCIDYLPELEIKFKQNNYIAPLLKLDSYGLPLYDFVEDFTIIDNYFPAFRDKVFEEVDNDDFDTDVPKGSPSIDDAVESLHYKRFVETMSKRHKIFEENNAVSSNDNPKKEERELNLRKLQQLVEERKQLETELGQLRTKFDQDKEQLLQQPQHGKEKK